ncbi:MAG: hypothetical protein IB618_00860 [Candidatus Pacearchaeota archaeon]|nr:MAG: hypothetical protein IB618_00860 [Candidatus Pacearchaeota archaeon]
MEIKEVKVELVDKNSRFVLKKIITNKGEFYNRQLAVSNSIYACEKKRLIYGKALFDSIFQTFHIMWNSDEEEWDFIGLKKAKEHSKNNGRIFIPYKQRNEKQWNELTWKEAEEEFKKFQKKVNIVPYPIPLNASLEEWRIKKKEALGLLEPNQKLISILSSKHHNINNFLLLVKEELKNSFFLGICCYGLSTTLEKINLSLLNSINSSFNVEDKTALIGYFDYARMLMNHSNIAGSFAYSCFAGDFFSEKSYFIPRMSKKAREKMFNKKPEDFYFYDIKEKKFNKSLPQSGWYGFDLTRNSLKMISVNEGLTGYQTIKWINHFLQQRDLKLINELLISKKNVLKSLKNYTGWNVFWDTIKPNSPEIQRTL